MRDVDHLTLARAERIAAWLGITVAAMRARRVGRGGDARGTAGHRDPTAVSAVGNVVRERGY